MPDCAAGLPNYAVLCGHFSSVKLFLPKYVVCHVARSLAGYGVASCGSIVGSYEIQLLESDNIQLVVIEDDCGRAGDIPGEYEQR